MGDREGSEAPADFRVFFETEYERLGKALYLVTGNRSEAEDLAQESFVRIFERWDRVSTAESPAGYLYRTALNLQRSRVRRMRTAFRHRAAPSSGADPLQGVDARDEVMRLLQALPLGQRTALVLVEWYGMRAEEAATAMGIKASTVRVHLSRARAAIRGTKESDRD